MFWLFYKGHMDCQIPNLLNVIYLYIYISSLPQTQDRTIGVTEVTQWQTASWVSVWFSPVQWGRKAVVVKVLQVSGCSWCRRAQGGPSPAMELPDAPGNSHRILLGHRRGSGAWTTWQWTHVGNCGKTGCPGQAPSRQVGLHPSLSLQETHNINTTIQYKKYMYWLCREESDTAASSQVT